MLDMTNRGVGFYDDLDTLIESMGAVSCAFLRRIHSEEWLVERFSINYPDVFIHKEKLAAHIDMLMMPPEVDLGLTFPPFAFPEDAQEADLCHEVLSEIGLMGERLKLFYEGWATTPQAWLDHKLDATLTARFLPLLKSHNGKLLFHAPHFFTFLVHFEEHAEFAALLSRPSGLNRELLRATYDTLPGHLHRLKPK